MMQNGRTRKKTWAPKLWRSMPTRITSDPPASCVLRVQEYFSYQTRKGGILCSSPTAIDTRLVLTAKKVSVASSSPSSDAGELTSPRRPPAQKKTWPPSHADRTKLHRLKSAL